ncbi:MAG: hypothetical protein JWM27_1739 [Gemmatimonadetes bacterium]|nr:hypothetical protein [Gemmatimonadota bacterium]
MVFRDDADLPSEQPPKGGFGPLLPRLQPPLLAPFPSY